MSTSFYNPAAHLAPHRSGLLLCLAFRGSDDPQLRAQLEACGIQLDLLLCGQSPVLQYFQEMAVLGQNLDRRALALLMRAKFYELLCLCSDAAGFSRMAQSLRRMPEWALEHFPQELPAALRLSSGQSHQEAYHAEALARAAAFEQGFDSGGAVAQAAAVAEAQAPLVDPFAGRDALELLEAGCAEQDSMAAADSAGLGQLSPAELQQLVSLLQEARKTPQSGAKLAAKVKSASLAELRELLRQA